MRSSIKTICHYCGNKRAFMYRGFLTCDDCLDIPRRDYTGLWNPLVGLPALTVQDRIEVKQIRDILLRHSQQCSHATLEVGV